MATLVQNFYKETLSVAWASGTGKRYVSALPIPTLGILVISPSSATLREIIRYTSTGVDGTGNYLMVSERGVGETNDQAHEVNEPIRMNVTGEHIDDLYAAIAAVVAGGAQDASTVTKGISTLSVAPASPTAPISAGTNDPRIPSQGENDALVGNGGTPATGNRYVTEEGFATSLAAAAPTPTKQIFTATGTYTKPAGLKYAVVELVGAGGNGGGVSNGGTGNNQGGAGGGPGGYSRERLLAGAIGATEAVTVGVNAATRTTSFGALLSATGGADGGSLIPGAAGVGSGGDTNTSSTPAQAGHNNGTAGSAVGASGGSTPFGSGGAATASGNTNGVSSTGYGSGGSGASVSSASQNFTGGLGMNGIVIVTEYYI